MSRMNKPTTSLFEQAVNKVRLLPDKEQNAIAALIFEELEDEIRWDMQFASSQNELAKLAAAAMDEDRAGKTQILDPDLL